MEVIDFKDTTEQMSNDRREMLRRLQSVPEKTLDEIQQGFIDRLSEENPDLARMVCESVSRSGNAAIASLRNAGWDVPGNEFEIRRDESDRRKMKNLDKKILQNCRKATSADNCNPS